MNLHPEKLRGAETPPAEQQALWARFRNASEEDFFPSWLALLASLTGNVAQGLLVMGDPASGAYSPVAQWSAGATDLTRLADICESVFDQRCGLLADLPPWPAAGGSGAGHYAVAYPVLVDDVLYGVVALEVVAESEAALASVMGQLQWGVSWLELHCRRKHIHDDAASIAGIKSSFDLLAAVVAEKSYADAANLFVTELATRFTCDRVSLGVLNREQIKLQAISHSSQFAKNANLVRAICLAMEEAVLQKSELACPRREGMKALVTRDHDELARQQGGEAVLTVPLYDGGSCRGAITLERPDAIPFLEGDISVCRAIAALIAPILEAKKREDRPLVAKAGDSVRQQAERLFGAGHFGRKLAALVLLGLILFLVFADGDNRVTATAVLEPSVRRSVVSHFNGYIKEAAVRPGDLVKAGALLCTLDDRDLFLERSKLSNQVVQYQQQRQEAMATSDRAKANIVTAQLGQAQAQLQLVQGQLERTSLRAPFDGIVVSGDLSQRIQGTVEQGEVLFELSPLNAYRLILQVDEYRIEDVRPGQKGTLVLPALTGRDFPFEIEKITPLSAQKEGKNYFRVEAALSVVETAMRPGMEGVGKVQVDRRRLAYIWTRDLLDWLRMKVWSWWP